MWQADVCNSISLKRGEGGKSWGKKGEEIKCLELFFFHRPMASQKMFPCVVSEQRLRAEKKNILPSKPHATDSF